LDNPSGYLQHSEVFRDLNSIIYRKDDVDEVKKSKTIKYTNETNLYMLTYADNSATGFFKKCGFSLKPVSTGWIKYIKDYEGGTLMEAKIHKEINYLKQKELLVDLNYKIME